MSEPKASVSAAFQSFLQEAPKQAQAWMGAARGLDEASALDAKTKHLAYLAVLAAQGLVSGVPFHADLARKAGATREEVVSAVLVGLPAAGNVVVSALPGAISVFDDPAG